MAAIITEKFRLNNAKQFVEDMTEGSSKEQHRNRYHLEVLSLPTQEPLKVNSRMLSTKHLETELSSN